ncbi:MAG: hypothetical protein ABFC42_00840 [Sulfuricella sp.]
MLDRVLRNAVVLAANAKPAAKHRTRRWQGGGQHRQKAKVVGGAEHSRIIASQRTEYTYERSRTEDA